MTLEIVLRLMVPYIQCFSVSAPIDNSLANSCCSWICCSCGLPNFCSSLFNSFDVSMENSFSSLDSSNNIFSNTMPLHCSSPTHVRFYSKPSPPKDGHLKFLTVNCRGLKSSTKRSELHELIATHDPDVIFGTESHLNSSIASSETFLNQYAIYRKDRNIYGGGVFIAIKSSLTAMPINWTMDVDCEVLWLNLLVNSGNPLYIWESSIDHQITILCSWRIFSLLWNS